MCLGLFLATCFVATPVYAKDPVPTAEVYEISGKKLEHNKGGSQTWKEVKEKHMGFIKDHFRTDADTTAALELSVGGRIGLKKDSEIVLATQREAKAVVDGEVKEIKLEKGGMWAKFASQGEGKKVNIRTSGGVMGIKGTEFSIESTGTEGQTDIVLLEGEVDYQENNSETVHSLKPGQKLSQFYQDGQLRVITGLPDEVDRRVQEFLNGVLPIGELNRVQRELDQGFVSFLNLDEAVRLDRIGNLRGNIANGFPGIGGNLRNWTPRIPDPEAWLRRATDWRRLVDTPRVPVIPRTPRIPGF